MEVAIIGTLLGIIVGFVLGLMSCGGLIGRIIDKLAGGK